MAVTHSFVSAVSDGGDASLVQPSSWNAGHTINDIIPAADSTYKLGASGTAWTAVHTEGVAFPATQVASADANTLDDYQEGTWTPTLANDNGTVGGSYSVQTGWYRKIGDLVIATFEVRLATWTYSGTGYIVVEGLPFSISGTLSGSGIPIGSTLTNVIGCVLAEVSATQFGLFCASEATPSTWDFWLTTSTRSGVSDTVGMLGCAIYHI